MLPISLLKLKRERARVYTFDDSWQSISSLNLECSLAIGYEISFHGSLDSSEYSVDFEGRLVDSRDCKMAQCHFGVQKLIAKLCLDARTCMWHCMVLAVDFYKCSEIVM